MKQALLGGVLIVAGIALRVLSQAHRPVAAITDQNGGICVPLDGSCTSPARGWSPTVYDIARVGFWALVIFGVIVVVFALVRQLRA